MDQLRYNIDKPCATYWYANHLALERFETSFAGRDVCPIEDAIVHSASNFLANAWNDPWAPLVRAVMALLLAIEDAAGTAADLIPLDVTPMAFLAHCENALSAYDRLCEAGERKYARGNYRHGAPITQYLDSFFRHLHAHLRGKLVDAETEATHLTCALWNAWQALNQPRWRDNRLPPVQAHPITIEDAYPRPAAIPVVIEAAAGNYNVH